MALRLGPLPLTSSGGDHPETQTTDHRRLMEASWRISQEPPADLEYLLETSGGGFFHSPLGLEFSAPNGQPLYATLEGRGGVLGVAVGVRSRCRLSRYPRHAYFPTLPALRREFRQYHYLQTLAAELEAAGIAEVTFSSFGSDWIPANSLGSGATLRHEHLVPLDGGRPGIVGQLGSAHRRKYRRGEREGWVLELLHGNAANSAMELVLETAATRATALGRGFVPGRFDGLTGPGADSTSAELRVYAALTPHGKLLAAALIGLHGTGGYYLLGGSTPEGYSAHTAPWMHCSIMAELAEHGHETYNLGGTPASAADPTDPGHGLYRFKSRFGGEASLCQGLNLTLRPTHIALHTALRSLSRLTGR